MITSGHTIEFIDSVRGIVNFSTGQLGAAIAEAYSVCQEITEITYISNFDAAQPKCPEYRRISITNVASLSAAIDREIARQPDIIIHAMAISDFTPSAPIGGKLESAHSLDLRLIPTPKIITKYREAGSRAILVGFKLLANAPHDELLAHARALMAANGCDFVLANDLKNIAPETHEAFLLSTNGDIAHLIGKTAIARAITAATLAKSVDSMTKF